MDRRPCTHAQPVTSTRNGCTPIWRSPYTSVYSHAPNEPNSSPGVPTLKRIPFAQSGSRRNQGVSYTSNSGTQNLKKHRSHGAGAAACPYIEEVQRVWDLEWERVYGARQRGERLRTHHPKVALDSKTLEPQTPNTKP
jgi:hypothetical protein